MSGNRARVILALCAALVVFGVHGWYTMYGVPVETVSRWMTLEPQGFAERLGVYATTGGVWLGYCYGVAAGFGLWSALSWYSRRRAGFAAAGGLTLSGAIAAFACFMTGCCGSPMLAVWVGLLGAAAAPWLGPAAALLTTVSVAAVGYGMWRRSKAPCTSGECNC